MSINSVNLNLNIDVPALLTVEQSFGVIPVYRNQDAQHQFLLIQHRGGHWGFPKGHAEEGETELQTARRELREETGVENVLLMTSPIFEEHYSLTRKGKPRNKLVRYWLGYVPNTQVQTQASEVQDFRWVTLEEARALITYAQSRKVLEDVTAYLEL